MKPTTQLNSEQNKRFPLTDYHYQATLEASHAGVKTTRDARSLGSFRKFSEKFFKTEAKLEYAIEFCLFGLITALSVWPVFLSAVAVVRMMQNY